MANEPSVTPSAAIDYRKADSFGKVYANNVYFENTAWDLKMIFGEVDQSLGANVVSQHTAVTMPWPQAKVFLYFLSMHVAFREMELGRLSVPANVINPPLPPDNGMAKEFPNSVKIYEMMKKHYDEFIAQNPEARPTKI